MRGALVGGALPELRRFLHISNWFAEPLAILRRRMHRRDVLGLVLAWLRCQRQRELQLQLQRRVDWVADLHREAVPCVGTHESCGGMYSRQLRPKQPSDVRGLMPYRVQCQPAGVNHLQVR